MTGLDRSCETSNFSQLVSRLVKPKLLSFYVSVFVCIGVYKSRFSYLVLCLGVTSRPSYKFSKSTEKPRLVVLSLKIVTLGGVSLARCGLEAYLRLFM